VQPPNDNPAIAVEAEQEMENKKKVSFVFDGLQESTY
jgi:hypothetical protein